MGECHCENNCPGSSELNIERYFAPGAYDACPTTPTASINDVLLGLGYGALAMIPGAAGFWDPLSDVKSQLSKSQGAYNQLAQQWQQCLQQCANCEVQDQLQIVNDQLQLVTANQALINEQLQEQITTLSVIVFFVVVIVFMILAYILIK